MSIFGMILLFVYWLDKNGLYMLDVIKNVVIREFSSYVDLNYPWEEVTRSRAKAQDEAVCLVRAIPFLYPGKLS